MDAFQRAASEHAAIALLRAGNFRGAEARLRTMLGVDPNDARALALLARCRFEDGDKKEGLAIARSAAALRPDDPLVKGILTYALQHAGKDKAARAEQLQLAEDAAAEAPDDSDALFNLAVARLNSTEYRKAKGSRQLHQYAAARDLIDDAERYATDAYELLNVARFRLRQWDYEAAQLLAQRAMVIDPTRPDSFRILAECAIAHRQPLDAYELALEALRLDPGDKETLRLLTRARARSNPWLRPFLPMIDWIVEMDRRGLVVVPAIMAVLAFVLAVSVTYDMKRMDAGQAPAIILSLAAGVALLIAAVSYVTAIAARWRIRRDLRKLSLPRF